MPLGPSPPDPTQRDRQGPDHGTQYRSAIFPQSPEQARIAKAYIVHNDLPKVENLKKIFPERYRAEPVLVGASS